MLLREVFEWLTIVLSDGMPKVLVNDVLGDVFQVTGVKQDFVKSIKLAICIIENVDQALLLNIFHL